MLFNSSRKRIIIIILSLVLAEFNLEQCSSAECGIAENNDDARLSYLVLIFGIKEQIIYKSCIGTVIKLTFNDTFSDLILTSRTCLEKEDLHSSRVSEMLHISWYGPTHGIVKKLKVVTEGAPLLCRINNTDYQYGIYDWTKLHRVSKNTSQPIAIFTELYPFNLIFNFFASNMTYITDDSIIL
ncbi:conserved hypothetical protein [Trichinella spiralis]|uniref:hypothetical protein n=1 Tax=Trichinella spiralis TaxID=6334 RepID=UPI0001EFE5FD|nr:conserved hypothetical protein [Trichinella spiralis]